MTLLGMSDQESGPNGFMVSDSIKVGEFGLSRDVIVGNRREFLSELSPIPEDYLPENVQGCEGLRKSGNILKTYDGEIPQNGDCKIVYEYVKDGFDCSFIVQATKMYDEESGGMKPGVDKYHIIDESRFCQDSDLGDIWIIRKGRHGKDEMIDMAKEEQSSLMTMLRIISALALIAGWVMLFSPLITVLSILPIAGSLGFFAAFLFGIVVGGTCFCTVTTIAYVRYRPLIAFGLLALAGIIWGIIGWRLDIAATKGE